MKKVILLITALILVIGTMVPIHTMAQSDFSYYSGYSTIEIKGETQPDAENKFVTLIMKEGDKTIAIGETSIDSYGKYSYMFRVPHDTKQAELFIKCGDEDITSTVYEVIKQNNILLEVPYSINALSNGTYSVSADLSELNRITDDFVIILAQYADSKLVDTVVTKSSELENIAQFDTQVSKKGDIKMFVWNSTESIIPVAHLVSHGKIIIDFGPEAYVQQLNGYSALGGDSNYEIYKQALAELPQEFSLVDNIENTYERKIYVSPTGDDSGDGSIESPYATLQKAIDVYSSLTSHDKKLWTAIYLMGGNYQMDSPLDLTSDIAGENGDLRLYIGAYNGENVTMTSSYSVTGRNLTKVTSSNTSAEVMARIHPNAEGKLYYCDYDTLGIETMSGYSYGTSGTKPSLLYNSEKATLARYPNGGDTYIVKGSSSSDKGGVIDSGYDASGNYTDNVIFTPEDSTPFTWTDTNEVGMAGQLSSSWTYMHMKPTFDTANGRVMTPARQTVAQGFECRWYINNNYPVRSHFYYYNVFEELDIQGEWCSSDDDGRIYIYPFGGTVSQSDKIKIKGINDSAAIRAIGVNDLVIDSINFDTLSEGVYLENCNRAVIQNSAFTNISGHAVRLLNCENCGVMSSDFKDCYGGVRIWADSGNYLKEMTVARNFVQNCHFNTIDSYCVYIGEICGNIVSHNLAENFENHFVGIYGGSENVVEYNESFSGGRRGNEANIVYVDGQYNARHNHIRYNYFHDNSPDLSQSNLVFGVGIVFDDLSEDNYAYGNVIKYLSGAVGVNCGDNNIIDSNVIIDCSSSVSVSEGMYGSEEPYTKNWIGTLNTNEHTRRYFTHDLGSSNWAWRYPYAAQRMDYMLELSKAWANGTASQETKNFNMAATGNYVINNTVSGSSDIQNGNKFNYVAELNPETEQIPKYDGMDYGVSYNNLTTSGVTTEGYTDNMGLKDREPVYSAGNSVEMLYSAMPEYKFLQSCTIELVWKAIDKANCYKVTVATNEALTKNVNEYWVVDNRLLKTISTIYSTLYYKVEAYNAGQGDGFTTPFAVSATGSVKH